MRRWRRSGLPTTGSPATTGRSGAELFRRDPGRTPDANLSIIAGCLRPDDRLVDVGGGAGRVSLALAGRVREVVAVEPSAAMRAQFVAARAAAGIANARVTPERWADSSETGEVVHLSDVTYFVRDIVPFLAKLHRAAARRVLLTVWHPRRATLTANCAASYLAKRRRPGRGCRNWPPCCGRWGCCRTFARCRNSPGGCPKPPAG